MMCMSNGSIPSSTNNELYVGSREKLQKMSEIKTALLKFFMTSNF
jgi:hypothetical protein